ncbi:MAG: sigma-70 family RNA polymerase sigma factor, partial [Phycisphaerae bacterium]|nr:sigma-70 family RNA polymerase sigma factor [Phycisphaerae bacterium]
EYAGLAWRLATRYLGQGSPEIDDAVQDIFTELWLNARRFDPAKGSEPSFVATIIHRRLTDYQRRRGARTRLAAAVAEKSPAPDAAPRTPERLQDYVKDQDLTHITRAFDTLPDEERTALWLSLHRGLSHSEIATATLSPIGTVKTRLRRGLARLSDVLRPVTGRVPTPAGMERGA